MTRLRTAIENDLKLLALLRDELKLQAHLFTAELNDSWEQLERKSCELKTHVDSSGTNFDVLPTETELALRVLVDGLLTGYRYIQRNLRGCI